MYSYIIYPYAPPNQCFLCLQDLGLEETPSEARRLFHLADEGHSGGITFFEFCHFIFPELDVEWLYDKGIVTIGNCKLFTNLEELE